MSQLLIIWCDSEHCKNSITNDGLSDGVNELIQYKEWYFDKDTDEYHYCDVCGPDEPNAIPSLE